MTTARLSEILGMSVSHLRQILGMLVALGVLFVFARRRGQRQAAVWRRSVEAEGLRPLGDANGFQNEVRLQFQQFPVCHCRGW